MLPVAGPVGRRQPEARNREIDVAEDGVLHFHVVEIDLDRAAVRSDLLSERRLLGQRKRVGRPGSLRQKRANAR
jgi:hypothetical protein